MQNKPIHKHANKLIISLGLCLISSLGHTEVCKKPKATGYQQIECLSDGMAAVKKNDKWGFIDSKGKPMITPQYSEVARFSEGLAFVANQDGLWGVIDKTGKLVIPYRYDGKSVSTFSEGLADVYYDGSQGYINKKGTMVIPPQYYSASSFHKGYAPVMPSPKEEACINKKGQTVNMKFCQR